MLLITVDKLPLGDVAGRKQLGRAHIVNCGGDGAYGSYAIEILDAEGRVVMSGHIAYYPRHAGHVFDLVARGLAAALSGREALPPRPVHPWRQDKEWQ
ncbi:hypothetical protein A9R05_21300 [Burkholderia sp. KK1]|nr:hypothetical protein A9R05_21300 [Burkholderia sp. KK1]